VLVAKGIESCRPSGIRTRAIQVGGARSAPLVRAWRLTTTPSVHAYARKELNLRPRGKGPVLFPASATSVWYPVEESNLCAPDVNGQLFR
jgi:hypothetical protein